MKIYWYNLILYILWKFCSYMYYSDKFSKSIKVSSKTFSTGLDVYFQIFFFSGIVKQIQNLGTGLNSQSILQMQEKLKFTIWPLEPNTNFKLPVSTNLVTACIVKSLKLKPKVRTEFRRRKKNILFGWAILFYLSEFSLLFIRKQQMVG